MDNCNRQFQKNMQWKDSKSEEENEKKLYNLLENN